MALGDDIMKKLILSMPGRAIDVYKSKRWLYSVVVITLVENMVKKNCNRFPIAVLLITLICSH
jgi:hypothetical protein